MKSRIGWIIIVFALLAMSFAARKAHADELTNSIQPCVEQNARKVVVHPVPRIVRPKPVQKPDLAIAMIRVSIASQKLTATNKSGAVVRICKVSTAKTGRNLPVGAVSSAPHNHIGTFSVLSKEKCHWSKTFGVPMHWALRFTGGHFLHQTSKSNSRRLGTPASHGCVRLSAIDARWLYDHAPVGAVVIIE